MSAAVVFRRKDHVKGSEITANVSRVFGTDNPSLDMSALVATTELRRSSYWRFPSKYTQNVCCCHASKAYTMYTHCDDHSKKICVWSKCFRDGKAKGVMALSLSLPIRACKVCACIALTVLNVKYVCL
jgi:hypothetical protein